MAEMDISKMIGNFSVCQHTVQCWREKLDFGTSSNLDFDIFKFLQLLYGLFGASVMHAIGKTNLQI